MYTSVSRYPLGGSFRLPSKKLKYSLDGCSYVKSKTEFLSSLEIKYGLESRRLIPALQEIRPPYHILLKN